MLINTGSIVQNYKGWTLDTKTQQIGAGTIKTGPMREDLLRVEGLG
jgi:hypothetical protein